MWAKHTLQLRTQYARDAAGTPMGPDFKDFCEMFSYEGKSVITASFAGLTRCPARGGSTTPAMQEFAKLKKEGKHLPKSPKSPRQQQAGSRSPPRSPRSPSSTKSTQFAGQEVSPLLAPQQDVVPVKQTQTPDSKSSEIAVERKTAVSPPPGSIERDMASAAVPFASNR